MRGSSLLDVQGIHQPTGSQHAKGLLVEIVEPAHHAAGVGVAAETIEAGQQRLAIAEAIERDAIEHHVGLAFAVRLERGVGHAQEARLAVVGPFHVSHFRRQADKGRHRRVHRALELGHHRTQRRPTARRLLTATAMSGDALEGVVRAAGADDRTDRNQLVHVRGDERKMLADLDAGHVGFDRSELAANFRRRVHFKIEEVLMRRSAGQEDHDDPLRLRRSAAAGHRLGSQDLRQRKAAQRQPADLEERSPRHLIAKTVLRFAEDFQHGRLSCRSIPYTLQVRSTTHPRSYHDILRLCLSDELGHKAKEAG